MDAHTFSAVILAVMMSVVLSPTLLRLHLSRSTKTASCCVFLPQRSSPLRTPSTRPPNALRTSSRPAPRTPHPTPQAIARVAHAIEQQQMDARPTSGVLDVFVCYRLQELRDSGTHTHTAHACTRMHTRICIPHIAYHICICICILHMHMHMCSLPAADRLRAGVGSECQVALCGARRRPRGARLPLAPPRGPPPRLQPVGGQRDLPRRQANRRSIDLLINPSINLYLSIDAFKV